MTHVTTNRRRNRTNSQRNNSKKLSRQKKERFEQAVQLGRSHLTEAVASIVQGDPDVALSVIDENAYLAFPSLLVIQQSHGHE